MTTRGPRIESQLELVKQRAVESLRLLPDKNAAVEAGINILDSLAHRLGALGKLETQEASIRVLSFLCTSRVATAHLLVMGGCISEGYEILRSAVEVLAQQHLFIKDGGAVEAWLDGDRIDSARILKAVDEDGFRHFWGTLSKHAHPTLDAIGVSARPEEGRWVFEATRQAPPGDLSVALDAVAGVVEREIQLLAMVFGARLGETVEDARRFRAAFDAFRAQVRLHRV